MIPPLFFPDHKSRQKAFTHLPLFSVLSIFRQIFYPLFRPMFFLFFPCSDAFFTSAQAFTFPRRERDRNSGFFFPPLLRQQRKNVCSHPQIPVSPGEVFFFRKNRGKKRAEDGTRKRNRTSDQQFRKLLLYPLSYPGAFFCQCGQTLSVTLPALWNAIFSAEKGDKIISKDLSAVCKLVNMH